MQHDAVAAGADGMAHRDGAAIDVQTVARNRAEGTVKAQQKISSTVGGLTGPLGNLNWFGSAVAPAGDIDGDGVVDLVVGNYGDDDGGPTRGAVWILFMNTDGTVKAEQKISSTTGGLTVALEDGDWFGWSVAGVGDLGGDGIPDIAVGSMSDDDGFVNAGATHIIHLNSDGTVKAVETISATSGGLTGPLEANDGSGSALAPLGDLDGNGTTNLAIGAWGDDDGGNARGALYIVNLATSTKLTVNSTVDATDSTPGYGL